MGVSASERAELRALAAEARKLSVASRAESRAIRERASAARERHREVHQQYLAVLEASVQGVLARALRAERPAADPDAMVDLVLATSVTLMALRPKVDTELAPLIDDALRASDDLLAQLGDLARTGGGYEYLWWDDLREIDELASAIYEHLAGGGGGL
jgi:hypothetical protein